MSNHPTYSPHHCLVCGVPIKSKHFCSLKCRKEYCEERIWLDYILMEISKKGFVTNQEFTTLTKKYLVKKMSRAKHYIVRSEEVFPLYYLQLRVGYISKEFLEELKYRGIGCTYLHKHPCIWSIHKKVFDQALVNYQEAIR